MKQALISIASMAALAIAAPAAAQDNTDAALEAAIAHEIRSEQSARDEYRHPAETIRFMQIEPGMTIVDYAPGSWYANILVPYLGPDGTYIGAIRTFEQSSAEGQSGQRVFPERYTRLTNEAMDEAGIEDRAEVQAINTIFIPEEIEGTADRVLLIRMMHNLHRWGVAPTELANFRKLLKDDGLLGIVQHRAPADASYSYADGNNGYLRQADVIKLVEAHGFELVDSSEINANPKDTADHEGGVWQIPPVWASEDEAKKAIGESDRMTLLFKKAD